MTIFVQVPQATNLYTDLYNWVVPALPLVPLPIVQNAIRDAVIELCEKALLWRQELSGIQVLGPTSDTTTDAHVAGDTFITVTNGAQFKDGDYITISLGSNPAPGGGGTSNTDIQLGVVWSGRVFGTPVNNVITLDGPLTDVVVIGATVLRRTYLYPISVPTGTAIVKGLNAWLNNNPIDPISQDDLDNEFNNTGFGWVGVNWRTDVNLPSRWYMPDDTTVGLLLAPNAGGNLRLNVALKPTHASTTFPSWLYERYLETIAHGAKAKLMSIPKKPYSDLAMAAIHAQSFNDGIAIAKVRMARGNTRAPIRNHTVFGLR